VEREIEPKVEVREPIPRVNVLLRGRGRLLTITTPMFFTPSPRTIEMLKIEKMECINCGKELKIEEVGLIVGNEVLCKGCSKWLREKAGIS